MGENITLTAEDGFELGAYRARPEGTPRGGVVVIQEIFGVNVHIRAVCDGFAADGYLAVAPALYDRLERDVQLGYTEADIARGREIRGRCDLDAVIRDAAAAADAAAEAGKVGIAGYCWGGLVTYLAACRLGGSLACASSYYGGNIVSFLEERPAVPIIFHFGTLDAAIPMDQVEQIGEMLPEATVHVYEGADHGFNCDRRKQYNPEAAALARERTLALFSAHLG
jgi:carboxymethylenebutenolidase